MQSQRGDGAGGEEKYGGSDYTPGLLPERGSRRRKLAAMAGSVYRAAAATASEVRDQYNNTRFRDLDTSGDGVTIPGSFPDVAIVVRGDQQMVLFPSYAKRHVRQYADCGDEGGHAPTSAAHAGMDEEEYWHHEWARLEDEKAIVDVDVRGWVYNPHKGPMNRKNRLMIGLARRLSGIPPPTIHDGIITPHEEHEEAREQQRIAKEAEAIEKKGQGEKEVATRGGYSEAPRDDDSDADADAASIYPSRTKSGAATPGSAPGSPAMAARTAWNAAADLTEAELAVANANLMARLGPFLTSPLAQLPVTLFFYNEEQSVSRTVMTNDTGHFSMRAGLEFVPTHVRVLANEDLSAIEPIQIIENTGVSLISDIDDTIKRSNISLGAREIFRNTFIRDLADLSVEGAQEWYNSLHEMGVQFHYCSNSPWQLFPVLATFFKNSNFPPGSLHLKQYSGMLQGIFEPVAERKKGTLERIMRDFPERKFLLVGDSGEADLEVYTDLVQANPGRILAVFIRDVTTPEQTGYFDAAPAPVDPALLRRKAHGVATVASFDDQDTPGSRPSLPPRVQSEPPLPEGPVMGDLIDFSDEPAQISPGEMEKLTRLRLSDNLSPGSRSALALLDRKAPPPRPPKPLALRGAPSDLSTADANRAPPSPPPARRTQQPQTQKSSSLRPHASTLSKSPSSASLSATKNPPPPPPRRRATPTATLNLSPRLPAHRNPTTLTAASDVADFEGLGPSVVSGYGSGAATPAMQQLANKKVELWRRRLARAQETLDRHGVQLYTWRRGEDVVLEAVGIVREAMRGGREGEGKGKGKRNGN